MMKYDYITADGIGTPNNEIKTIVNQRFGMKKLVIYHVKQWKWIDNKYANVNRGFASPVKVREIEQEFIQIQVIDLSKYNETWFRIDYWFLPSLIEHILEAEPKEFEKNFTSEDTIKQFIKIKSNININEVKIERLKHE